MPNHDRFECQTAIDSDAILHRPFGGEEMPFNLSTESVCRIYDGYLREVIRFFIYVITAVSLVILVDKSLSGR
ncbi:Uncharacterised protein [Escherichia coli]|nr:Uncharacterised protein [Escherichia coli]